MICVSFLKKKKVFFLSGGWSIMNLALTRMAQLQTVNCNLRNSDIEPQITCYPPLNPKRHFKMFPSLPFY